MPGDAAIEAASLCAATAGQAPEKRGGCGVDQRDDRGNQVASGGYSSSTISSRGQPMNGAAAWYRSAIDVTGAATPFITAGILGPDRGRWGTCYLSARMRAWSGRTFTAAPATTARTA
jgi:hypothetical protein